MNIRKLGLSLGISLATLSLMPTAIYAQTPPPTTPQPTLPASTDGIVQGQITNKTANGKSTAGISVELNTSDNGKEKSAGKTTTDDNGHFQFPGVYTAHSTPYQVSLTYQEADYTSDIFNFNPGETSKSIEIPVWDSTATDPGIKVQASHVIVQFEGANLKVTEYYSVVNPGDKTYIGSQPVQSLGRNETLRFYLPPEAQVQQLALGLSDSYVAFEKESLIDTMGVLPGTQEIAFIYATKFSSPQHVLSMVADLPTDQLNLVVEDKGMKVSSPQMSAPQQMKIQDLPVVVLGATNLTKGQRIEATISGLPSPGPFNSLRWVGIGLMGIALVFGVTYPLMRRRRAVKVETGAPDERQQLLIEVAGLDDAFEAGKIAEDEYVKTRSAKMARLMALSRGRE